MNADRHDVITGIGLIVMGIGLWMLSPAAALIAIGGVLVFLGIVGSIVAARRAG